jgi:hypothetical protein
MGEAVRYCAASLGLAGPLAAPAVADDSLPFQLLAPPDPLRAASLLFEPALASAPERGQWAVALRVAGHAWLSLQYGGDRNDLGLAPDVSFRLALGLRPG